VCAPSGTPWIQTSGLQFAEKLHGSASMTGVALSDALSKRSGVVYRRLDPSDERRPSPPPHTGFRT
jgi:hypothetical protein